MHHILWVSLDDSPFRKARKLAWGFQSGNPKTLAPPNDLQRNACLQYAIEEPVNILAQL